MAVSALGSVVCNWILWLVSLCFVLLRLWVRSYLQNRLSLSDALVVVAMLLMTFTHVADSLLEIWVIWKPLVSGNGATPNMQDGQLPGLSNDWVEDVPEEQQRRNEIVFKLLYFSAPAYVSVVWSIKCSFILFYYHLFPATMKKLRFALHATAVLVVASWVAVLFVDFLWCLPVSRNWDQDDPRGICFSYSARIPFYMTLGFHILTDLLIFILPFFILPALNLSIRKKLSLCAVFALGFLSILSAAGRAVAIAQSKDLSIASVLSAVEMATSVIVACCPPLKWLYHSYKLSSTKPPDTKTNLSGIERARESAEHEFDGRDEEFGTLHFRRTKAEPPSPPEKRDEELNAGLDLENLGISIDEPRMPRESSRLGSGTTRSEDQDSMGYGLSGQFSNEQLSGLTSPYRPRPPTAPTENAENVNPGGH